MLQVSKKAIEQVKEELKDFEASQQERFIRLHMGMGWGGPALQLALEESSNPKDTVTEVDGVTFLYDKNQSYYFEDMELDYRKGFFGSGQYTVVNP